MMSKRYQVIYADPPWSYDNKKIGNKGGSLAQYDVMDLDDICVMNIPSDKNSILFLWATVPLLPYAFKVMDAWGFKYKTMITWIKMGTLGMGFWYRGGCEHLLFGVKGNIKAFKTKHKNFIGTYNKGKHSEKPEEFRRLIERSTNHLPNKLELFARKESPGWDVFGNEVNNSIIITNNDK